MRRFLIACGVGLLLASPFFARAGTGGDGKKEESAVVPDAFFFANLRLFLDYDFYAMIELFRYYEVMRLAEERKGEK